MASGGDILELLFRIRGTFDASDIKRGGEETRRELEKLRSAFQTQLGELQGKGLELLETQITRLTDKIPVLGPAISNVVSQFGDLATQSKEVAELGEQIEKIALASGKTTEQVFNFLGSITQLREGTEREEEALNFLGENLATSLLPNLDAAVQLNRAFAREVIDAATAIGKSDDEIADFGGRLAKATDSAAQMAETVNFLGAETAKKLVPSMEAAKKSVEGIAQSLNLPVEPVAEFLKVFEGVEDTATKTKLATGLAGQSIAQNLGPNLTDAAEKMQTATAASLGFVNSINAAATALGPYGIALIAVVVNLAAYAVAVKVAVDVGTALVKQFFDLAKSAAEFRAKLFDLSQQTGLSVELLSALEIGAKTSGGTLEGLVASILQFQNKMEQAQDPASEMSEIFEQLKITSSDVDEAFKQAVSGLAALGEGSRQTALAQQLFGRSSKTLIAIIKETGGNLDEVTKKAKELGIEISTADAEAADKFTDSLDILNLQFRALLGQEVIPAAITAVESFSEALERSEPQIEAIRSALSLMADVIGALLPPAIQLAISLVGGLALALHALLIPAKAAYELGKLIASGFGLFAKNTNDATEASKANTTETQKQATAQAQLVAAQKESQKAAEERVKAGEREIATLQTLVDQTELNADQNAILQASYATLDESQKQQVDSTKTLTDAVLALIEAKKQQLEIDKELAKTPEQRIKQLREEAIELTKLEQDRVFAARVQADLAKEALADVQRRFDASQATEQELRDQKLKTLTLVRDAELAITTIQREALLRREQAERANAQQKGVETTKELDKTLQQLRENEIKAFDIKENFRREEKSINEKFKSDQVTADLKFQKQTTENFINASNERIAQLTSSLATADNIRQRIEFRERESATAVIQRENEKNRIFIESQLKRVDLEVEVRKELNQRLADIDAENLTLEKQRAKEHIDIVAESATAEKLIALEKTKSEEDEQIKRRRNNLIEEQSKTVNVEQRRTIKLQLDALEVDQTRVNRVYSERRRQIIEEEFEFRRTILIQQAKTSLELVTEIEQRTTEAIRRQAEQRVITEEVAARRIVKARLDRIDAQKSVAQAELAAAEIELKNNPIALAIRREELNQRLKILTDERVRIETEGATEVNAAFIKDLENQKRYDEELSRAQNRRINLQLEAARSVLRVIETTGNLTNTRRRELLRAEIEIERTAEEERNRVTKEQLDQEASVLEEQVRIFERRIQRLTASRQKDTEEFRKAVEERDRTLELLREKNKEREAENTRHVFALESLAQRMLQSGLFTRQEILKQLEVERADEERRHNRVMEGLKKREEELAKKKELNEKELEEQKRINKEKEDEEQRHQEKMGTFTAIEKEGDPLSKFKINTDDIKKFANDLEKSIPTLGETLAGTFNQVANAIGSVVEQWVLLGTTGPAVMRKIVAAALANLAKEAAVNAVKELAVAFAMLAIGNFAGAGQAFISAGLWAAIAGGSALAGRAIAGNAFAPQNTGGTGSGTGSSTETKATPSPIDLTRPQETTIRIFVHGEPGPGFQQAVIHAAVRDIQANGDMRNIIVETAGS